MKVVISTSVEQEAVDLIKANLKDLETVSVWLRRVVMKELEGMKR